MDINFAPKVPRSNIQKWAKGNFFGDTLCQAVAKCGKVWEGVSRCVKVCQGVSRCVKVCQGVSRCVKVCEGV